MTCAACPFSCSEAAEVALNLGCLPSRQEVMSIKRDTGKNWSCHEDETRICAGFVAECRELGIDHKGAALASYSRWYHEGKP